MTQEEAVAQLAKYLLQADLKPESLWALTQVAALITQEGVGGTLMVKVPRKGNQPEVAFTTGAAGIELKF